MRQSDISFIDSHTGGEPTRLVISGGPDLGDGSVPHRLRILRQSHDWMRSAVVCEPRGFDALVGALLLPPERKSSAAGIIFFNNVGYLGMCGHGLMGAVASLAYLGKLKPGVHAFETPVGIARASLTDDGLISIENVPSYRYETLVTVQVDGVGTVCGDIAWGGNWFFLTHLPNLALELSHVEQMKEICLQIRRSLYEHDITGRDGAEIDHIELYGPTDNSNADSRNFVLCPGAAYDRSPCGTGTSAKMACLYADCKLAEGQVWRQEGITGSIFEGRVHQRGEDLIPTITSKAYITGEGRLIYQEADPLRHGIGH